MSIPPWLADLSLTHGPLHLGLIAGAACSLAGILLVRRDRAWFIRAVPATLVVAALVVGAAWLYMDVTKPWPDGLPTSAVVWGGAGVFGVLLLLAGWHGRRWRARAAGLLAAVVLVLGAADAVDTIYEPFPTLGTALQLAPRDTAAASTVLHSSSPTDVGQPAGPLWQAWRPPHELPRHGAVVNVDIPATRSGFPARPAWVYLPPAYLTAHRPLLPVLVLIGGQPGSTRDWLDGGALAEQMDSCAAAHHGLAPVVVMPDALGGETANPMCLDSALGRADTYLAQDVPAWITQRLQVDAETARWAVGGFSYGGTCALQLALAHPALFPTFLDESGQAEPTLGGHARSVHAAFGGNEAAFTAVDPLHELATRRYPGSAGYLVVGAQDGAYRPQARVVAAAARSAGIAITYTELPGKHSWSVWRPGFTTALPWLAARMGLSP